MYLFYRIFFIFLFLSKISSAQPGRNQIKLIDSMDRTPVSDATLSINGKKYHAANKNGEILLLNESIKLGDTLRFSHIGYKSKIFIVSEQDHLPNTIEMASDNRQLLDVTISKKNKAKFISIGNTYTAYFTGYLTFLNSKYALFVPFKENYNATFKSIQLKISDRGKGQRKPLKINIYSKSVSREPGHALINDDIIVSNPKGKINVVVDISKYNLQVPSTGFFIVVETLSAEYYDEGFVKSMYGQLRSRLPAFFWTDKKKDSENYSMYQFGFDLKKQWIDFSSSNFCFSAKIQVNH